MAAILTTLAPDYTPPEVEEETDTGDPNGEMPNGRACASVQMSWPGFGLLALAIGFVTDAASLKDQNRCDATHNK